MEFHPSDLCANGCGDFDESKKNQCRATKLKESGKYAYCRLKEDRKAVLAGDSPDYSNCDARFEVKFPGAEAKTGGICTTVGDVSTIENFIAACTDEVGNSLAGGGAPTCDAAAGKLKQTGQTQCDQGGGTLGPCPGSPLGQDGAVLAGLTRSYTDNGDGTVTDNVTGLMWEKLSDDGSIHDWQDQYTWYDAFNVKISALNAGSGFAGRSDWRLPNVNELQSLVNYGSSTPAVDTAFNTNCAPGCTVTTCSCTRPNEYWSATPTGLPNIAWFVDFSFGVVSLDNYPSGHSVRAVRGGL